MKGKPRTTKTPRRATGRSMPLRGGPFNGKVATLSGEARRETAQFESAGQVGRYVNGNWVAK
ncbi:MAG: hypothetical protein A2W25_15075 [candidate division Zixibacteria bacterium RBG_16_53_22]|nr:MAG: hypothetical protein A2W25_15075 [candidate division Zixibacteria bacterium RBG_16_53_22]